MNGPAEAYLGIKFSATFAGLVGALISLRFIQGLTWYLALASTLSGAAAASYLTPMVVVAVQAGPGMENAIAFVIGLIGMNVIAGIVKLSVFFATNPVDAIATAFRLLKLGGPKNGG